MNQCLRISCCAHADEEQFCAFIQELAAQFYLEGTVQKEDVAKFKIMVCGAKEKIEDFLDELHEAVSQKKFKEVQVEPFLKDRDYRGAFRVIE